MKKVFFISPEQPNIFIGKGEIYKIQTEQTEKETQIICFIKNVEIISYNNGEYLKLKEITIPREFVFETEEEFIEAFNKWIQFVYLNFVEQMQKKLKITINSDENFFNKLKQKLKIFKKFPK